MTDQRYLYRYEAKSIQKYVLASDRLKEIKGASALIEGLGERLIQALERQGSGGTIQYAAAGGASVTFRTRESAEDFRAHWPLVVARHAPGLQIAQTIVDLETVGSSGDPLSLVDRVAHRIDADRALRYPDLPEAGPLVHRAPRSGLPAVRVDPRVEETAKEGEKLFDPAAAAALAWTGTNKGHVDPLADRVLKHWPQETPRPRFVENNDELDTRYLAVVCADGNDMGNILRKLVPAGMPGTEALRRLTDFSNALSEATAKSVSEAVLAAWDASMRDAGTWADFGERTFVGRPIVVGGDDVTFIVRADLALPFAKAFLSQFEKNTTVVAPELRNHLTASAGIAFVHQNYPFHLALDLAESLCKFAKDALRDAGGAPTPSVLHFHRVTASMSESYRAILARELTIAKPGDPAEWRLSMGPYLLAGGDPRAATIDQLEKLAASISRPGSGAERRDGDGVDAVPRGAVSDVVALITEARTAEAQARLKRIEAVMTDAAQPANVGRAWRRFHGALVGLGAAEDGCWRSVANGSRPVWATPLSDALELIPISTPKGKRR